MKKQPTTATPPTVATDKKVYVLTSRNGGVLVYGSAAAMLADATNGLSIDRNQLNYRARGGWPVEFDGLTIHRTDLRRKVKPEKLTPVSRR